MGNVILFQHHLINCTNSGKPGWFYHRVPWIFSCNKWLRVVWKEKKRENIKRESVQAHLQRQMHNKLSIFMGKLLLLKCHVSSGLLIVLIFHFFFIKTFIHVKSFVKSRERSLFYYPAFLYTLVTLFLSLHFIYGNLNFHPPLIIYLSIYIFISNARQRPLTIKGSILDASPPPAWRPTHRWDWRAYFQYRWERPMARQRPSCCDCCDCCDCCGDDWPCLADCSSPARSPGFERLVALSCRHFRLQTAGSLTRYSNSTVKEHFNQSVHDSHKTGWSSEMKNFQITREAHLKNTPCHVWVYTYINIYVYYVVLI